MDTISIFWFRRDLRLSDNTGLLAAQKSGKKVLPVFIFDKRILDELEEADARVSFIREKLSDINDQLKKYGSGVKCFYGEPVDIWKEIIQSYNVEKVYANRDYEPYAPKRDSRVQSLLESQGISFQLSKDQVIFEMNDVLKGDGTPYTVYTPYKNKWLEHFHPEDHLPIKSEDFKGYYEVLDGLISLNSMGFVPSDIKVKPYTLKDVKDYEDIRNFPARDGTSYLSPHLRFGTIGIRELVHSVREKSDVFLSELIWREFFMQILYHFPHVQSSNFRRKYDGIQWRNNEDEFKTWCEGNTGYPMVDAGMRELNATGYMHNRVRMVVASFLCKHLLIDWRWGEAYFAKKLLDYDLSANNGNWQWAAGTGCDASPYFRVFNPESQLKKFDKELKYVKKWVPEYFSFGYPEPMVEHKMARERCLETYKSGIA